MIYQTIATYLNDDCADEFTIDLVFAAILEKDALALQPNISRFYNRMDDTTLQQLELIEAKMRSSVSHDVYTCSG